MKNAPKHHIVTFLLVLHLKMVNALLLPFFKTMSFRRRLTKIAIGSVVAVPVVGTLGVGAYVAVRVSTQPPQHVFKPLVREDGSLLMNDGEIPPPTRMALTLRVMKLLWIFLPMFFLYWFMKWTDDLFLRWSRLMLRAVERAGPAFTKLGQWAVTRSDLFPKELRKVFEKLYSEVSEHSFETSLRIIKDELKSDPYAVFSSIDPKPLGSGSIGQVHKAVLKETGETVVIKVMHPGVVETICKDFFIINGIARFVHGRAPSLEHMNIQAIALDWTRHLAAQLDFRIEEEHLKLFREHFKGVDFVEFPKPHFATQRVLVEGWVPGIPATPDFLSAQAPHVRSILAGKGLNCFCKMMLRDNFIHGDMHPGNILIDTSDPHYPRVYMIDVGLCQKLTEEEGLKMNRFTASFVKWDHHAAVDAILSMGDQRHMLPREQFEAAMGELFTRYRPVTDETDQVVSDILQACFECVRHHRVNLGPEYVSQLWCVLVLEGFINALDPNFNMVRHAAPWLVSEGHISFGLIKNIVKAQFDKVEAYIEVQRRRAQGQSVAL
jgi:aarF domain-containing kinase